jgi:dipeptidase E
MRHLLLVSTSTTYGTGYLEHCRAQIQRLFRDSDSGQVLFVPYALHDRDWYADKAREAFADFGLRLESIHRAPNPVAAIEEAEGIFIGGGNTFRLLKALHDLDLIDPIRGRVLDGVPYLGTSAGSNVACPTIMTTNDMPIVYPPTFEALNLVPFQINAHYQDPDPDSTHMGETRDTRIREFHEENSTPVIGLREGSMLRVLESEISLLGKTGGKIFLPGRDPLKCTAASRIGDWVST